MKENQWLQFFENISCWHRKIYTIPLWKKYPNYAENIWDALAVFLEGYAFERQGRSPNYCHVATDALQNAKAQLTDLNNIDFPRRLWSEFSNLLNGQGLNINNNPLYFNIGNNRKKSLIEVVTKEDLFPIAKLKEKIQQKDGVLHALKILKSIRGIGDKIASLFLRDLIDMFDINNLEDMKNRNKLQPIDIWVRRTVKLLANEPNMTDPNIALWIVNNSEKPERINMGIWFFGANIAKSEYRLKMALQNINSANKILSDYIEAIKSACSACKQHDAL